MGCSKPDDVPEAPGGDDRLLLPPFPAHEVELLVASALRYYAGLAMLGTWDRPSR